MQLVVAAHEQVILESILERLKQNISWIFFGVIFVTTTTWIAHLVSVFSCALHVEELGPSSPYLGLGLFPNKCDYDGGKEV